MAGNRLGVKNRLYEVLVRRNAGIQMAYETYTTVHAAEHQHSRTRAWRYLLKLNLNYYVRGKLPRIAVDGRERGKPMYHESGASVCEAPQVLAVRLAEYDVISFDVFDTLLFRPFQEPESVFYLIGEKLGCPDFHALRSRAALEAHAGSGKEEVTLAEIYAWLERYAGIDAQEGMRVEMETELELCYPNPYMQQVIDCLVQGGETWIAVSDMYLPPEVIRGMLEKCGYKGIKQLYVSGAYGVSKRSGKLYRVVREEVGRDKRMIHIGDHPVSDVKMAKKAGMDALYYPNVHAAGRRQRPTAMSPIVGSAYAGIVNAHLHNGIRKYTPAYEYGYTCGGLFVLGYCRFIHEYARVHAIDKVLFLSRDGETLKAVYDAMYPGNTSAYAYWSRFAGVKAAAKQFKYAYLQRCVTYRANHGERIRQVLEDAEIWPFFEGDADFARQAECYLTDKTVQWTMDAINGRWADIVKYYDRQALAAKAYYKEMLSGCKRVCVVDIGWAGSAAIELNWLVRTRWRIACDVYGVVAGTNTPYNDSPDYAETFLQTGRITPYIFSQALNRELLYAHNPIEKHNIYFEMLLSACGGSLRGIYKAGRVKKYRLEFDPPERENEAVVQDIRAGIEAFVTMYCQRFRNYAYLFSIPGCDAYAPFRVAASDPEYMRGLFQDCVCCTQAGGRSETIVQDKRKRGNQPE